MNWLRQLLSRRALERDLADEIQEHLEEKEEELVAAGLPRAEARDLARRTFGNVTLIEERGREVWRWQSIEDGWADVRYAVRQLRHTPSFALAMIVTLALGIGANTTIFSVINAVLLRPLPFAEPDGLVAVASQDVRGGPHPANLSYPTFFDFRRAHVFERIAVYRDDEFTLTGRGAPIHLAGQIVSWDLLPLLGVRPIVGRSFVAAEEQRDARVVIVSHSLWTSAFGADPGLVGRAITIDGEPHTVVGVAPEGFNFPLGTRRTQLWTTLARDAASATVTPITEQRGSRMLDAIARLRPAMSITEARTRLDAVALALAHQYPDSNQNLPRTYVIPELERLVGNGRYALVILWAAVVLVLLVACANLANMLLARTTDREREFSVRLAIGGSRARVIRQLVTENLVLALVGSALGIAIAVMAIHVVLPLAADLPRASDVAVDHKVLAFTIGLAVLTSVLVSVPPALRLANVDFQGTLRGASRSVTDTHDRVRGALVVSQIAIGLVLLSSAGLLSAGFVYLMRRDLGFQPDHLLSFAVTVPGVTYDTDRQLRFTAQLLDRLRHLPGAVDAAAGMPLPLAGSQMTVSFNIIDRPSAASDRPSADMAIVTPGYFRTIGTPLLEGRDFNGQDDRHHPRVLIVNRAFANRYFPGEPAIGKRLDPGATSDFDKGDETREIVGVVGNARQVPLGRDAEPIYYFPLDQMPWGIPSLIVRSSVPALSLEPAVRRAVQSLDKEVPVHDVETFDLRLASGIAGPRFQALLMGGFAAIALLLTATGLYGVLAYAVLRRTREIGVRMALGASRISILTMIGRRAGALVAGGLVLGLVGALSAHRVLAGLVYAPATRQSLLLVAACVVVTLTAAVAAYVPARRAASIDPTQALRAE
jgi:predicted permease